MNKVFVFAEEHCVMCGAVIPEMIVPLIVTKLTTGITAVIAALIYLRKRAL